MVREFESHHLRQIRLNKMSEIKHRLTVRMSDYPRLLVQTAANLINTQPASFIVDAAVEKALDIIQRRKRLMNLVNLNKALYLDKDHGK